MESRINKSKIFRETANYKLRGTTFDAMHLDKLITFGASGGEKKTSPQGLQSSPRNQHKEKIEFRKDKFDNFRPDVAFVSLSRDLQKQQRYVDQYDGPSSLITKSPTVGQSINLKEAKPQAKASRQSNLYDTERKIFYKTFGAKKFFDLSEGQNNCEQPNSGENDSSFNNGVKTSRQQYVEYDNLRKKTHNVKHKENIIKERRAKARQVNLVNNDSNPDNNILPDDIHGRVTSKLPVDVDHHWKSKKLNPEKFINTHEHIFTSFIPPQKQERLKKISDEEARGRHFNIISNAERIIG